MTSTDRAAMRRLAEQATPGPWLVFHDLHIVDLHIDSDIPIVHWAGFDSSGQTIKQQKKNAKFIAAARTFVPAALDALDAAEREIERLRARLDNALLLLRRHIDQEEPTP